MVSAFGVAALGAAVGTVAGILALSKAGELKDRCGDTRCRPEDEPLADEARARATVSTVGFVVGGVAATVGTILLFTRKPKATRASASSLTVHF